LFQVKEKYMQTNTYSYNIFYFTSYLLVRLLLCDYPSLDWDIYIYTPLPANQAKDKSNPDDLSLN